MRELTTDEALLLREAQEFLRTRIRELGAMLPPSSDMRARLAATEAFERVDGLDEAEEDPIWDLWATLDICLERYLLEGIEILTDCVENPGAPSWDDE